MRRTCTAASRCRRELRLTFRHSEALFLVDTPATRSHVVAMHSIGRTRAVWRRVRVVGLWFGASLGGIALAVLLASFVVSRLWNHEKVGRSVSAWVSATLRGHGGPDGQAFRIGRVDYEWWPAVRSLLGGRPVRVDVWDIGIWDPDGREVIYAPHVQTGVRLHRLVFAQLWGRLPLARSNLQLHFVDAVIERARCRIAKTSEGETNLVAAFKRRRELPPPDQGGMVITVDRSTVLDGTYAMAFAGWSMAIEHFSMQHEWLRYSSFREESAVERPAFVHRVARLTAPSGELLIGAQRFPLAAIVVDELRAEDPARQHLRLAATATSHGARIEGRGMLSDVYGIAAGVDVTLGITHARGVLASLPTRESLRGDPSAKARVRGPFSHVVIEGDGDDVALNTAGIEATDARAHFRWDRGALDLSKIDAKVANGRVTGKATLVPASKALDVDVELDGLELARLGRVAPLQVLAITAAGIVRVVRLDKLDQDAEAHFQYKGLKATVYVRPKATFPHRLTLHGNY